MSSGGEEDEQEEEQVEQQVEEHKEEKNKNITLAVVILISQKYFTSKYVYRY